MFCNCVLFGQTAIGTVLGLKFVSVSLSYVCSTWPAPQVVVGGRRISVSSSETQSSVEVSQACVTDTGSYTLVVRNRKGSAQHTISLSVIGEAVQSHSDLRRYNPALLLQICKFNKKLLKIQCCNTSMTRYYCFDCVLRPARPASVSACRFPVVKSVPGPVLDGSQLRRRQSCARLHRGGQTRGSGRDCELD